MFERQKVPRGMDQDGSKEKRKWWSWRKLLEGMVWLRIMTSGENETMIIEALVNAVRNSCMAVKAKVSFIIRAAPAIFIEIRLHPMGHVKALFFQDVNSIQSLCCIMIQSYPKLLESRLHGRITHLQGPWEK
jgi:hypothetical protein